ncbi:MAG: glycosyltransferase [Gemmatimonadetes bacterium]|nr:glycosyltransferase [Gemmatimonadota bacterium]
MKILHLSKFYPPDPGGLEQVVAHLAEGAAARGHQVRVVAATGSSWARDPGKRITEPPRKGVVVVRLPTHGVLWSQPLAPGYLAAARWPADVVYVHHPHPLADLALMLGPRRPTVILHHSDVQRQQAVRLAYRPLARLAARRAAAVVVATQSHLGHARDIGGAGQAKARVIPFGVDVRRFAPRQHPTPPPSFPPPERGPVGVFVGRLVSYKGLDVLVRAVQGSNLNVVVVGSGPLRPALGQWVTQAGVTDRVILAGDVPDPALLGYYQAADYVVLPSTTPAEMFGMVLLEAMACAKPLVTTALSTGVREINLAGETGLEVPPGDADALRAAMQRLSGDAALRSRLGEAGRARVERHFTLDKMLDAHLALCGELAGA